MGDFIQIVAVAGSKAITTPRGVSDGKKHDEMVPKQLRYPAMFSYLDVVLKYSQFQRRVNVRLVAAWWLRDVDAPCSESAKEPSTTRLEWYNTPHIVIRFVARALLAQERGPQRGRYSDCQAEMLRFNWNSTYQLHRMNLRRIRCYLREF